jgi:hypothetical protein
LKVISFITGENDVNLNDMKKVENQNRRDIRGKLSRPTDDFLCLIRQVRQQHICASEGTDLSRNQMKADRSSLIIAHGMKF